MSQNKEECTKDSKEVPHDTWEHNKVLLFESLKQPHFFQGSGGYIESYSQLSLDVL